MLYYGLFFIVGACLGSFFANWIERNQTNKSVWHGLSVCPQCGRMLRVGEIIPIFSFVFLKRTCRGCGEKIAWFNLIAEIAFAALYVSAASVFKGEWTLNLAIQFAAANFLLAIAMSDWRYGRIYDSFVAALFICALLEQVVFSDVRAWLWRSLALLAALVFFGSQWMISRGRAIGQGDVKLGAVIGFMLIEYTALAVALSYISGGLVAAGLLMSGQKKLHSRMPLGTFLALSTMAVMIYLNLNKL